MTEQLPLPHLPIYQYRFEFTLQEKAHLPPHLGAILRGGFGILFKRLVCLQTQLETCDDCLLLHTCAFPAVFQPPAPPQSQQLRTHQRIPVPYILQPPPNRTTPWQAGETLPFNLLLVGHAIKYLPYFVLAFQQLGQKGLGRQRKKATLERVLAVSNHQQTTLWQGETLLDDWQEYGLWDISASPPSINSSMTTLQFFTPTRLKYDGSFMRQAVPFHILIRNLLRRVSSLSYFYADTSWDIPFTEWIDRAQQVIIEQDRISWQDWKRFSSRQKKHTYLGGIVGQVTYRAPHGTQLNPFLPLLSLGELIHVGKGTAFGNGRYRLLTTY